MVQSMKASVKESRSIYDGRVVRLQVDTVDLPNGNRTELEIIRHSGAAAVVPIDGDDVVMVKQYRHAAGDYLLEVPAGKLDPGETPRACALREMQEEVGLAADEIVPLGWIWTTPGFTDEKIWLYLAPRVSPAAQALEEDEVLTVERLPLERALEMAFSGDITDGKSACALMRAAHLLGPKG